ncbi:HK97 gp10 family phage protein [Clostridium botulinum]|uniref:hypothetical protein n=1 Tax=Clostridium botulinum TaxID=1491 RepID=UPI000774C60A|nr:hypothetical protein [Clostridium botulinum]MBN3369088.1 hypothetical protein [Clostridium botulinum]MBN3376114.1 hypothetical protein [Clostridium botulinum]MBY6846788.1 HK97 gp10 family phage protein [Clostridium botulinum]
MNGFDAKQLDKFSKGLLNTAKNEYPKKTKAFLRGEGRKLTKIIKNNYQSTGAIKSKKSIKKIKTGKLYKRDKSFNIRSYGGGLHNLLNNGYTHKGGRDKTGKETWIEGFHYVEKSQGEFETQYYKDIDNFLDELFD